MLWQKVAFYVLLFACLTPYISPPIALALGLVLTFTVGNPFAEQTNRLTPILLHGSVILFGFGMNLTTVLKAGKDGILFVTTVVFGTLFAGYLIGRLLNINGKISALISAGTAVCGGAMAAVAPAVRADTDEIFASFGVIFIFNSVALFLFPVIGHYFNLSQNQFGVWAAISIHDTSSVVGAAQYYGAEALAAAATVKLIRTLWIVPVALLFSFFNRGETENKPKIAVPYFILFFLAAVFFRTYAPVTIEPSIYDSLINLAKAGLTVTLFLIGAGLSRETLKKVGIKPLVQGIVLWILISVVSLWAVLHLLL